MGNTCFGVREKVARPKRNERKLRRKSESYTPPYPPVKKDYDYKFKVLMCGDSNVGKSSLVLRFADNTYSEDFISTIGVDFKVKKLEVGNNMVQLAVWDTAGQERFRTISSGYYRGAHGIIIVFDVTNKQSFENISNWMQDIDKYSLNIAKVLVGNKADLKDRQIQFVTAQKFAQSVNMEYFETSAKENVNVLSVFTHIASEIKDIENGNALD